jgi:hypothetical protein
VAKSQSASTKLGLTRGKAVLIGVLALALVGVLYIQHGRSGGDEVFDSVDMTSTRATLPRPERSTATNAAVSNAELDGETQAALLEFDQAKWKTPKLSAVIAYDPFALPPSFPQPPKVAGDPRAASAAADALTAAEQGKQLADALEGLRTQLEDLKQRGVHVIVSQNDQYVAIIGDRTIHVGDEINEFTVTAIDPEGVRVEWKGSE